MQLQKEVLHKGFTYSELSSKNIKFVLLKLISGYINGGRFVGVNLEGLYILKE